MVEVKATSRGLVNAERQLTNYMAAMHSPVGTLVTPEKLWLYRNQCLPDSEESIRRVGGFNVGNLLRFDAERGIRNAAMDSENAVQSWIESFTTESGLRGLPIELRRVATIHSLSHIPGHHTG